MNIFTKISKPCNGVLQQKLLKQTEEKEVWYGTLKDRSVSIKINKFKNDKKYNIREFNNTKLAYELFYKDLSALSDNPLPKPICVDERKLVLSYIKGKSREWPFSKSNKMGDSEYRAAAKYLAKLHSTEVKETGLFCINKLKKDKYGGSSISGKLKDDCNKLNCHKLSNYEEKLKKIAKYIQGALYENKWWHYKDLVYSHGDFKPDNFVFLLF